MIIGAIVIFSAGIALLILGILLWKRRMVSLLHDYHYEHLREENKAAFCRLSGLGLIFIAAGILLMGIILLVWSSLWGILAFGAGFVPGIVLLAVAGARYNRKAD